MNRFIFDSLELVMNDEYEKTFGEMKIFYVEIRFNRSNGIFHSFYPDIRFPGRVDCLRSQNFLTSIIVDASKHLAR